MADSSAQTHCSDPYDFNDEEDVYNAHKAKRSKTAKEAAGTANKLAMMDPGDLVKPEKKSTISVAVETEPSFLGPCEPGTSVILEAVVWHESNSGILVLNVTWRGKKYIGTLLDSSRHEWAPPSFRPESPSSRSKAFSSPMKHRGRRGRGGRRPIAKSPRKWGSSTSQSENFQSDVSDETVSQKPSYVEESKPEPLVVVCTEAKCNKKFRGANSADALEYHRIHAHASSVAVTKTDCKVVDANQNEDISVTKKVENSNKNNVSKDDVKDTVSVEPKTSDTQVLLSNFTSKTNLGNTGGLLSKDAKKIAVLKPLVPTIMPKASNSHNERTLTSLITPTYTLTASSSNQPQGTGSTLNQHQGTGSSLNQAFVSSQPLQGPTSTTLSDATAHNKHMQANSRVFQPVYPNPGRYQAGPQAVKGTVSVGNEAPAPLLESANAKESLAVSGKSHKRNSLNYSDISDASDQESEPPVQKKTKHTKKFETQPLCESALEDRLYCNEELSAPSPTLPALVIDEQNHQRDTRPNTTVSSAYTPESSTGNNKPVKHSGVSANAASVHKFTGGTSNNMPNPVSSVSNPVSGRSNIISSAPNPLSTNTLANNGPNQIAGVPQMLPHHAQPMVYPYFPFMPTSQVPGVSFPSSSPVYAAPYLMTYAGIQPFIPTAGPPPHGHVVQGGNQPTDRKVNSEINKSQNQAK